MSTPITTENTCFDNILGIRGLCAEIESATGFYANDIDIDSDFIEQIRTRSYFGVKDFHEKKLAFAVKEVVNKIKVFLAAEFKSNTLLDSFRIGIHQDNLTMVAGDGNLKGINIDLAPCQSYVDLFVSEIALQTDRTGNIDVAVYDLVQDKLIDTITIACVANEISRAFPRRTYQAERQKLNLLFCYDSTGISSNTTYLNKNGCSGCGNKKLSISNPYQRITPVSVDPADAKVKSSLTAISETGGMSIVHSLTCNHESWLCSFIKLLAPAVLYRYGELVMEFAATVSPNDRINTTVAINAEAIKERKEIYAEKFKEEMKHTLQNIKTPRDKECFVCKDYVTHQFAM